MSEILLVEFVGRVLSKPKSKLPSRSAGSPYDRRLAGAYDRAKRCTDHQTDEIMGSFNVGRAVWEDSQRLQGEPALVVEAKA